MFLDIGHAMIANLAPVMPALMLSTVASAATLAVLSYRERSFGWFVVTAGLALLILVVAITVLIEVPIDNQIRGWTPTTVPADWSALRDRWAVFHLVRTFASLMAVVAFLTATIFCADAGQRVGAR